MEARRLKLISGPAMTGLGIWPLLVPH